MKYDLILPCLFICSRQIHMSKQIDYAHFDNWNDPMNLRFNRSKKISSVVYANAIILSHLSSQLRSAIW